MNECRTEKVRLPVSDVTRRKMSASMMKREPLSEETKAKMLKASLNKKFPPRCNKCNSRDLAMCARFNMKCLEAKDNVCFRSYVKRSVHPDYIGTGVHRV
jgi:hypothetical protein